MIIRLPLYQPISVLLKLIVHQDIGMIMLLYNVSDIYQPKTIRSSLH